MKVQIKLLLVLSLSVMVSTFAGAQTVCNPALEKRRTLIIGLDGTTGNQLHFQALKQNKMPAVKRLMTDGLFTPCLTHKDPRCARAHSGAHSGKDYRWLTAPGWLSVLTGVDNIRHGVRNNDPSAMAVYTKVSRQMPTLFMRARENGLQTAAGGVASFLTSKGGKPKPGILDYECGFNDKLWPSVNINSPESCNLTRRQSEDNNSPNRDEKLAGFLQNQIDDANMSIIMGVFDGVDSAGHDNRFSSTNAYLKALTKVDGQIAPLLDKIRDRSQRLQESWLVILTSDHGGHDIAFWWGLHGTVPGEDDAVPFILTTYGSCEKTQPLKYPVRHMDVHPTVMSWHGIPSAGLDGKIQGLNSF